MATEKRKVDYYLFQLVPLKEAADVSEVVPALPTSVGRGQTPLGATAVITKVIDSDPRAALDCEGLASPDEL